MNTSSTSTTAGSASPTGEVSVLDSASTSRRRERLQDVVEQAANLLPVSGPITSFAFLNTLQALEDRPFDEGLQRGSRLFGAQPYLPEATYRKRFAEGRIRHEDLSAVLIDDLGDSADHLLGVLGTRFGLRMAMLEHALQCGRQDELRWYVAETDALRRMCEEVSAEQRKAFLVETRHWVMRDIRHAHSAGDAGTGVPDEAARNVLAGLLTQFNEDAIERWNDETWERFSLQALWRICVSGVRDVKSLRSATMPMVRHRDWLRLATHEDSDWLVHALMIRLTAAFVDQGFADWQMPYRERGFYQAFLAMFQSGGGPPDRWLSRLPEEVHRLHTEQVEPLDSILESLDLLGVDDDEFEDYLSATMLALRGWAGIIRHMEVRPDRVPHPVPPHSLMEFLAVRLILERHALAHVARETMGCDGTLVDLRDVARERVNGRTAASNNVEQRAFQVFQLAQFLGWMPHTLIHLNQAQWSGLIAEIESFDDVQRRRIFHRAFERRYRVMALDAIATHARRTARRVDKPRFQAAFCIDAREESFRRHLEEVAPDTETFGAAGFFGVAMYYRGAADAHYTALCPIVVQPKHWVVEDVVYTFELAHRRRARTRRALGTASHQMHLGSRSMASGALLTASVGVLASIPMVARVLFPRLTAKIRRTAGAFVAPPPVTRLRLERTSGEPGPHNEGIGFSVREMADIGERMLRDIGLTSNFARLVIFFGHGSFCLNNPHKSAYDCGACTGNAGSPNARALAAMLNDRRVRDVIAGRGMEIPDDTFFIGGLHNTCDDTISFLDLDLLPRSHVPDFESAVDTLETVCERNAHERCRRFDSAPLNLSLTAARRHVEGRSQDLAQTRPEFGNATNSMCFVGRRERVRGLYMDRRSFLQSYDPLSDDDDATILARILSAVIPVCEGINMQYFLSSVDSPGWGCGTKLPHNVTSLLGVMDGAASDLRPGLPWQGVEIHEPVRCLFVIESTPEKMNKVMDGNPVVARILRNGWAQLAVLDPHTPEIHVLHGGKFERYRPESRELPQASSSIEWYRGWRGHLNFAEIES
ncbi:MAG: DUF2309 domain-containing protein [Planctomycetales bacterium]|nr:DUF2309 domain-containing protein [Planctomycetales bacterium]